MTKRPLHKKSLAALALALAVPNAFADSFVDFGPWYEFAFLDAGTPATGCTPADPGGLFCIPSSGTPTLFAPAPLWRFTVDAGDQALLIVTDAFDHGDAFDIFNFGAFIGSTSPAAPLDFVSCGDDPVPCLADPLTSHGEFLLGPGDYAIGINPNTSAEGGGVAYFQVTEVPEPPAIALSLAALLLVCKRLARKSPV